MFELRLSEKMLLALLRSSLHQEKADTAFFSNVSSDDWQACYQLAVSQGVMALAWEGVMTLPAALQPSKALKLNWALSVEACEKRYRRYCQVADELSRFYAAHGIAMLQIKGVGYSLLYPVPSHREGGDIDIYTYAAPGSGLTDVEANALADSLMQNKGIEVDTRRNVKHSEFYYKGIPVENHKTFLDVEQYDMASRVEQILRHCMDPQVTSLEEGEVLTPSVAFNSIFIAFHALGHFPEMMKFHHLYDWAVLIKRYGLQLPAELKDPFLLEGIAALTQLCNEWLGTSVPIEKRTEKVEMMKENMLRVKYPIHVPVSSKIGILVFKTKRMMYCYHMKRIFLPYPMRRLLWNSVVAHIKNPETIFRRKIN